jgi:xanthine dehydrogenase accessory factor
MSEIRRILDLWSRAKANGEEACLTSIVGVEGSSYRKPGARMLLTSGGLRAGTLSGGCLEAEIAKKAWWLTEKGATVQQFSSFFDEDTGVPHGLGCGGSVHVLMERGPAAEAVLEALRRSVEMRQACAVVSAVGSGKVGTRTVVAEDGTVIFSDAANEQQTQTEAVARDVLRSQASKNFSMHGEEYFAEYVAPPRALFVFGAGDDAQPLTEFAHSLGWFVTVADGRSNLARAGRFPLAGAVTVLRRGLGEGDRWPGPRDAAVIMTHSYEQDGILLRQLLPLSLTYLGILGPRARTERLIAGISAEIGAPAETCLERLHAPVGLDIGAHNPAAIALSIVAEIQAVFAGSGIASRSAAKQSAQPMRTALHA